MNYYQFFFTLGSFVQFGNERWPKYSSSAECVDKISIVAITTVACVWFETLDK